MSELVITGIFTLLGVALGLFGERWVRSRGEVLCDTSWIISIRTTDYAGVTEVVLDSSAASGFIVVSSLEAMMAAST